MLGGGEGLESLEGWSSSQRDVDWCGESSGPGRLVTARAAAKAADPKGTAHGRSRFPTRPLEELFVQAFDAGAVRANEIDSGG